MNNIVKNFSKVLALTVLSTNFSPVFAKNPKLPKATVQTSTGNPARN